MELTYTDFSSNTTIVKIKGDCSGFVWNFDKDIYTFKNAIIDGNAAHDAGVANVTHLYPYAVATIFCVWGSNIQLFIMFSGVVVAKIFLEININL